MKKVFIRNKNRYKETKLLNRNEKEKKIIAIAIIAFWFLLISAIFISK